MPAVKCYLGQSSSYLYEGEAKRSLIHQWLSKLVKIQKKILGYILASAQPFLFFQDLLLCLQVDKHAEQLQDATPDLIHTAIYTHNVTILAFPDHHNHHHVEEKVFQVKKNLFMRNNQVKCTCSVTILEEHHCYLNERRGRMVVEGRKTKP